jgi:hypothetical protein
VPVEQFRKPRVCSHSPTAWRASARPRATLGNSGDFAPSVPPDRSARCSRFRLAPLKPLPTYGPPGGVTTCGRGSFRVSGPRAARTANRLVTAEQGGPIRLASLPYRTSLLSGGDLRLWSRSNHTQCGRFLRSRIGHPCSAAAICDSGHAQTTRSAAASLAPVSDVPAQRRRFAPGPRSRHAQRGRSPVGALAARREDRQCAPFRGRTPSSRLGFGPNRRSRTGIRAHRHG